MEYIAEFSIALLAFIGTLIGSIMSSQKTVWRIQELEKKMDQVEAKMEKHNRLMERVFLLEHDSEDTKAELERLRNKMED